MYVINYSDEVKRNIREAFKYIAFVKHNPTAARNLLDVIPEKLRHLSPFPESHQLIDVPELKDRKLRFVAINSYIAFYRVDHNTKTVNIVDFMYGARNWRTILQSDPYPRLREEPAGYDEIAS